MRRKRRVISQETIYLISISPLGDLKIIFPELKKLRRKGTDNLKMRCPFHDDKTPSFSFSKTKCLWYCYGCGKGGDIIKYYMERAGVDFFTAVLRLAKFFKIKPVFKKIEPPEI